MAITITDSLGVSNDTNPLEAFNPALVAEDDSFMADLARPAIEAAKQEEEELNQWRDDTLRKVDDAVLNFGGFLPEKSQEVRRRVLVRKTIDAELGWNPSSTVQYRMDRRQAAQKIFGEDIGDSDEAFVGALTKRATERKEEREFYGELRSQATISAIMGGQGIEVSFGEQAKENPIFQKDQARAIREWKATREAILEEYDEVIDEARSLIGIIEQGEVDLFDVADIVGNLEDEDLTKLAKLIGQAVKHQGEKGEDRGVMSNLFEQGGRDINNLLDQQKGGLVDYFSKVSEGLFTEGEEITGIDTSEGVESEQARQERLERTQRFVAEVRRFRDQRDPIKTVADEGSLLSHVERGVYASPGVGMSVGLAAVPVTGMASTGVMLHESVLDDYYLRAVDAGVERGEAREVAGEVAGPVAALMFLPERIGVGMVTKRLPGLSNVINKMNSKVARLVTGAAVRSGGETVTEEIQAIIQEAGVDSLNELKSEIPGADWDAHWANFGWRNFETFISIAPYSSIGAMVHDRGVSKSMELADQASEEELVASGHSRATVQKYQQAETEQEKRDAFFEMTESQDPESEETKEAAENLAALQAKVRETQAEAKRLNISPAARMAPDQEGFEVYDTNTGETIAAVDTAQEATETVFSIFGVKESQRQARFDELLSEFEAGRLDADQSGQTVEVETRIFTETDAMMELPGSDARIQTERMLIEQRDGGTGEVTAEVMGEGSPIAGVYIPAGQMGRKEAVTKLFNGSSVLTLIHERGHAKRRTLMQSGKWSRAQQVGSLKALDSMIEREGDRFLPASFDTMSETDQEVALDEAVAELAEVLALRTRKGGKSKMRGLINRNLSAMVRDRVPGAAQLSAFLKGLREFFGLALRRAAVLKKASRDGKIDGAQLDALTDMLVGVTPQEQFEAERDAVPTQMVDGVEVDTPFSIAQTKTGMTVPDGVVSRESAALPVWTIEKQEDSLPKVLTSETHREKFFARLDGALEWLREDPAKLGTSEGWVSFLKKAGVYGDVPMPPTGIAELFENPAGYVAKVKGDYHGDLTTKGTNESAKAGLDGTMEMRKIIGEGNAPAKWAVALHHLWGILSRMLPPIDQEGMWLRLIAHRPVLEAIQSSLDGDFDLSLEGWQGLVQDARSASAEAAGKIGNNATANANSFYLMLKRLNGQWDKMAEVYAAKDSRQMGREFWSVGAGALGIKNKVQRFIGLTFGVPGVIMDRWKFVELWLPTAVKGTDSDGPRNYFKYSNETPESPLPIYGVYGDLDAKNTVVSTALYEGLEVAMQEAINRSPELQELLGDHQNPGGLHWYGWNAIKNEAVGHSSLDLTKDLMKNYGLDFGIDQVIQQINEGEYFTEGTIGSSENAKVFLRNGKIEVSRTRISSGLQSGRGSGILGRGASEGASEGRRGGKPGFLSDLWDRTAERERGVSFSLSPITPAQDAAYLSAVESGDMETAQEMVDEAAKKAGFPLQKFYHGTNAEFDEFAIEENMPLDQAAFFSESKRLADSFMMDKDGHRIVTAYLKAENPAMVGQVEDDLTIDQLWNRVGLDLDTLPDSEKDNQGDFEQAVWIHYATNPDVIKALKEQGFDSMEGVEQGSKMVAVFNPNQIKSAEPVTYDEAGNVIPLSERFNEADDRISYQIGDSRMLSSLSENAKARTKRPEARAQIFGDIVERLAKLKRDVAKTIKVAGRDVEQKAIVDARTMKSLRKEAAFRQALKLEELEEDILKREGQALQSGDAPTLKEMPVHGFIANVGKGFSGGAMESRSAFRKRTGRAPGAEYEGSQGMVGGLLYGGMRSPDQMAQELFSEGLLSDDSPATMWATLASERESVATQKEDFKAAMAKMRGAKAEAKKFAGEWLADAIAKQERDYNPQERTRRALVMYDAILKALPPELRGKMGGFVKLSSIKTDEARLKFLEGRMEKADEIIEKWIQKEMTKEAKKLIKSGMATIETGEIDRGTKGATVHRLFEVIDEVFRGKTEAEAAIAGMEKEQQIREESGQMTAEWAGYYDVAPALVEAFGDWKKQSAAEMTNAVENAARFYDRGWLQTKIKAAQRAEMINAALENLRNGRTDKEIDEALTKADEAIGALWDTTKGAGREFIDFEQFLISTFGRVKVVEQLVDREYEAYRDREEMRVTREHEEAQFYADFFDGDKVKGYRYKHDLKTKRVKVEPWGSKGVPSSMTKSQIMHWLMMYRQPDGRRHFEGDGERWSISPEFMERLAEKLDERDLAVMDYYSDQYSSEWEIVNPIHEEVRGATLVKNEEYSPITVAARMTSLSALAGATMDPLSGEQVGAMNATPSMFKRRSKTAIAKPRVEGAIETFQIHKTQVEHWVATAEMARDLRALFGRREARELVEAKSGKTGLGQLQKWIEDIATQGIRDTSVGMAFWATIDRAISRVSRMALFGKISTVVIQASQVAGAAAQMPARAYMAKLMKVATFQLDLSVAWNSPYIRGRLADTLPMVRLAYSNARTKKPTTLSYYSDRLGQAIGLMDAFFTAGTYAAIFDHVKAEIMEEQGLTGSKLIEAAHKEAGKRTERVAQPIRKGRRSLIENRAQGNVPLRAIFAFASEPRQKLGSAFWEMFHAVRSRDKVKNALVYGVGFAAVSTVIRAAIADLRDDGEDDETFDDENWNAEKLLVKTMTDNFNGVPIVGPQAESGFVNLARKAGLEVPPSFPNEGLLEDPTKAIPATTRLVTGESMENSHQFAKDVRKTLQAAGMVREEAATAAVFWNMVEDAVRSMPVVE